MNPNTWENSDCFVYFPITKGQELVEVAHKHRPLHLSIVGGEPLVRFRELDILLPKLSDLDISVQIVTSAVREIPAHWSAIKDLSGCFHRWIAART